MKKLGRPTKFNEELSQRIITLAKDGKTEDEISSEIGISRSTLMAWKSTYPDFLAALKESKDFADQIVELSLFRRAIGYQVPETKVFLDKSGKIVEHVVTKHMPPDVTACIFWLKNRQKSSWKSHPVEESYDDTSIDFGLWDLRSPEEF